MEPITRSDLTEALAAALQPLLDVTREMQQDIKKLELSSAPRADVYTKDVMDEKLNLVEKGLKDIQDALKANREFTWKVVGVIGTVATLLAYFAPHLTWH